MSDAPFCSSCCTSVDNLLGIKPDARLGFWLCHACWSRLTPLGHTELRATLDGLWLLGADLEQLDLLAAADEAEERGATIAPPMLRALAERLKKWRAR